MDSWEVFLGVLIAAALLVFLGLRVLIYNLWERQGSRNYDFQGQLRWFLCCLGSEEREPHGHGVDFPLPRLAALHRHSFRRPPTWQPLPDDLIAALPAFHAASDTDFMAGDQPKEQQCPICQEEYELEALSNPLASLPCRHVFHRHCVQTWLATRATCPMCQLDLTPDLMEEHILGMRLRALTEAEVPVSATLHTSESDLRPREEMPDCKKSKEAGAERPQSGILDSASDSANTRAAQHAARQRRWAKTILDTPKEFQEAEEPGSSEVAGPSSSEAAAARCSDTSSASLPTKDKKLQEMDRAEFEKQASKQKQLEASFIPEKTGESKNLNCGASSSSKRIRRKEGNAGSSATGEEEVPAEAEAVNRHRDAGKMILEGAGSSSLHTRAGQFRPKGHHKRHCHNLDSAEQDLLRRPGRLIRRPGSPRYPEENHKISEKEDCAAVKDISAGFGGRRSGQTTMLRHPLSDPELSKTVIRLGRAINQSLLAQPQQLTSVAESVSTSSASSDDTGLGSLSVQTSQQLSSDSERQKGDEDNLTADTLSSRPSSSRQLKLSNPLFQRPRQDDLVLSANPATIEATQEASQRSSAWQPSSWWRLQQVMGKKAATPEDGWRSFDCEVKFIRPSDLPGRTGSHEESDTFVVINPTASKNPEKTAAPEESELSTSWYSIEGSCSEQSAYEKECFYEIPL